MVYYKPRTFVARKPFTIGATTYVKGDVVPGDEIMSHSKRGLLISKRYVMPDIDGRVRNHKARTFTPTWTPGKLKDSPDTWSSALDPVWPSATAGEVAAPVKAPEPITEPLDPVVEEEEGENEELTEGLVVPPAIPPLIGHDDE